ncbi:hypothetical protein [Paraherbaspirillum soli]|uniref:Type II secretion system protein GspC N-terminal domain-containing protein n=1 Tax=Paraherbaspirillum soli TaxID=631222 RepID=A0ABW0M749_9BURK
MRLPLTHRKLVLLLVAGVLALYSALHFREGRPEAGPAEPDHRARAHAEAQSTTTAAEAKPALALSLPKRGDLDQKPKANLFAATDWTPPPPPPPPPVKAAPPPPPQAPPLPFSFVGLLEDRSKPTAFLANGEALLIVAAGDTIDNTYHVDTVSPTEIALTYLPLNQKQIIRIQGEL